MIEELTSSSAFQTTSGLLERYLLYPQHQSAKFQGGILQNDLLTSDSLFYTPLKAFQKTYEVVLRCLIESVDNSKVSGTD